MTKSTPSNHKQSERDMLRECLRVLYEENLDYITRNNLGDPHHNGSMKMARFALEQTKDKP